MPEYLAPGVYIEEVPSGSMPIQGASTSTAGMVGVTARGPVNTPTLVTSLGAYARVFGGKLNGAVYTDGRDALPYAAEGFFGNGGSRLYVSRIVGDDAVSASLMLVGQGDGAATPLTAEATATDATTPASLTVGANLNVDTGDLVMISGRNGAEIATVDGASTDSAVNLSGLLNTYETGATVTHVVPQATVQAMSQGGWGNNLRITAFAASMLETQTRDAVISAPTSAIPVETTVGVYPGSFIRINGATAVEVASVADNVITLTAPWTTDIPAGTPVVSQEFSLRVELLDEDGLREEEEFFENLSLRGIHPRFAPDIIGAWPSGNASPDAAGASNLIRFQTPVNADNHGRAVIAEVPRSMTGGDDDLNTIVAATYQGTEAQDPSARTGIHALENEPTLSIVAVPGQTAVAVQQTLVGHCEKMRYRFAVLETPLGSNLAAARTHRQNFDSTRCAIYYPGLSIADPFGRSGALRTITPAGHMMGLYARTDNTRGVHKAPANEVVRGVMGFETKLTKGEQDILNPINLNCMRDFRSENRGLRCYGARVATSDPEWKYINVRRLLLYIEQSLDVGLQWAVFEPNDTPLWQTVRQSCTNFLNTTWRSGALQGTTQEQAFFVDIGLGTTMTQDDIDNGRMIVRIGVAPVKPAEFVIARISQKTLEAAG